jgi:hypothetical protein
MMHLHRKEYKQLARSILAMSATSNKSRILLLMMMVIALVFFVSSFFAATFTNPTTGPATGASSTEQAGTDCFFVRTAEGQYLADCMFS